METTSRESTPFEIVAVVADDLDDGFPDGTTYFRLTDLGAAIEQLAPELVVVAVERGRPEVFAKLLDAASEDFRMVGLPEFYEVAFGRLPVRELTPAWFMSTLHLYNRPVQPVGEAGVRHRRRVARARRHPAAPAVHRPRREADSGAAPLQADAERGARATRSRS